MKRDWWKWLLGIWMTVMILGAFLYTPVAKGLGQTTRVLYFHVPSAWVATLSFLISAIYSIRYLKTPKIEHDIWAAASAQIGFMFTFLATVTGAIWAKEIWHSYWNWDPRQTSIFVLMLIYAAYFALRSAIEEDHQKARLAAVYSILAFVTVPFLVFVIPRIYDSLHPDPLINPERKIKMDPRMLRVFLGSLFGFTVLFYWILRIKTEIEFLRRKLSKQM